MNKRVNSVKCQSLSPTTLEVLMFLKYDRDLWNLSLVGNVVNEDNDKDEDDQNSDSENTE